MCEAKSNAVLDITGGLRGKYITHAFESFTIDGTPNPFTMI